VFTGGLQGSWWGWPLGYSHSASFASLESWGLHLVWLLFPCRAGAAGNECGGARPRAARACLPRCLPSSAWAAGHAARVRLAPSSW